MKFTTGEVVDYVKGWLTAGQDEHTFTDAYNAVANAHMQFDDDEGGFVSETERRRE